jgi:hypothetical protein
VASSKQYISQKEISNLYDQMYGFSSGHTSFRETLGDILTEDRQLSKVAYSGSKTRKMEEKELETIHKDSDLSNSFSVLFSLGNDSAFGTYKPAEDRNIQKALIAKLGSMGHTPLGIDIVQSNEHFTLCAANYQTINMEKVSAFIPVQTTDGVVKEPKHLILGEEVVSLDSRNLFLCLKEQERGLKNKNQRKFAAERGENLPEIKIEKMVVPASLQEFSEIETSFVVAASNFSTKQINLAIKELDSKLKDLKLTNSKIKISKSDINAIIFDVLIPTKIGSVGIQIPVEIINNDILISNKFATHNSSGDKTVYDLDKNNINNFLNGLSSKDNSAFKVARHNDELKKMSYHQLMDQMISGVSEKDYKLAEDVLQIIEHKFADKYMSAHDYFTQLLKHSSDGKERDKLIQAAYDRGELIKVPTSVELYCPKLGLPVSKIAFDDKGRVIAKGRRSKLENQIQDAAISNSKIILT